MTKRRRSKQRNQKPREETSSSVSWHWYVVVIIAAMALFTIFIATQFAPIDRPAMVGFSVGCAGLALLIIGACTAFGKFEFDEDSQLGKSFAFLTVAATPQRRFGEFFYSRDALYVIFERILIALVLPFGFVMAFVRPKQTWPAIGWIAGGLLALVGAYLAFLALRTPSF